MRSITHIFMKNGRLKLLRSETRDRMSAPIFSPFLLHLVFCCVVWCDGAMNIA